MTDNTKIQPFNMKNIPLLLDVLVPLWSPPVGDGTFKRFNVEYIMRNNIFENEYNFELVGSVPQEKTQGNEGEFLSAAFFARKGDVNKAAEWFAENSAQFPEEYKIASGMSRTYIETLDERTFSIMNSDDIKLSLFVSRKPGAGAALLDALCGRLRTEGWKNLYLWTDCDCNWRWYEKHGFTLVQKDVYEQFSGPNEPYWTYIFKRKI
ncbi:MAG: hypothetical protein IKQ84_09310 [Spirochaetaceae bacterium]|nr:hypothetical protein [Spirochaetaceae bacterium]